MSPQLVVPRSLAIIPSMVPGEEERLGRPGGPWELGVCARCHEEDGMWRGPAVTAAQPDPGDGAGAQLWGESPVPTALRAGWCLEKPPHRASQRGDEPTCRRVWTLPLLPLLAKGTGWRGRGEVGTEVLESWVGSQQLWGQSGAG